MKCTSLRKQYPDYVIAKKKLNLNSAVDFKKILDEVRINFFEHRIDERDGMKIEFKNGWVQIRKSNTEPIMRIYAEGKTAGEADALANRVIDIVKKL